MVGGSISAGMKDTLFLTNKQRQNAAGIKKRVEKKLYQGWETKWINKGQQVLEYWLDNSSSTLSSTQTTVALHYLSQGFTMVTSEGEDEANFQLDN